MSKDIDVAAEKRFFEKLDDYEQRFGLNGILYSLRYMAGIARGYSGHGLAFSELLSVGSLAVAKAISKGGWTLYDNDRLDSMIRTEIKSALKSSSRYHRITKEDVSDLCSVEKARQACQNCYGREPAIIELAATSDIPSERIEDLRVKFSKPISLDSFVAQNGNYEENNGQTTRMVENYPSEEFAFCVEAKVDALDVRSYFNVLNEREKKVIRLKFDNGLTYNEIGQTLDISDMRAKKVYKSAVRKLRTAMSD